MKDFLFILAIWIILAIIQALIGALLWNAVIANDLGWTQEITAREFFCLEVIISLLTIDIEKKHED